MKPRLLLLILLNRVHKGNNHQPILFLSLRSINCLNIDQTPIPLKRQNNMSQLDQKSSGPLSVITASLPRPLTKMMKRSSLKLNPNDLSEGGSPLEQSTRSSSINKGRIFSMRIIQMLLWVMSMSLSFHRGLKLNNHELTYHNSSSNQDGHRIRMSHLEIRKGFPK